MTPAPEFRSPYAEFFHSWGPFLLLVAQALALGAALIGVACGVAAYTCSDLGEATGRRTDWRPVSGCFVEVGGRFIPKDAWREGGSR